MNSRPAVRLARRYWGDHLERAYLDDNLSCIIVCGQKIPKGWRTTEDEPVLCNKRVCWEKYLPTDMVKKYLTFKNRYDIARNPEEPPRTPLRYPGRPDALEEKEIIIVWDKTKTEEEPERKNPTRKVTWDKPTKEVPGSGRYRLINSPDTK